MSISKKLVLAFLVAVSAPIIVIAVIMVRQAQVMALENFESSTNREVRQINKSFSLFFNEIGKNVTYLAEHPDVKQGQSGLNTYMQLSRPILSTVQDKTQIEKNVDQLFTLFGGSHPGIAYIYMGNAQGGYTQWPEGSVSANYDPRKRPWYRTGYQANINPIRTHAYYWEEDDAVLVSTVKLITDDLGNKVGVTGMDVSLKGLTDMLQSIRLGKSGFLIAVEDSGKILVDSRHPENNFKPFEEVNNGLYRTLAMSSHGLAEIEIDGDSYYASIFTSEDLNWKFIGLLKRVEVMEKANEMIFLIGFVSLIIIAVFSGLSFYFARLISNPINEVSIGLEDISKGEGDLTKKLKVRTQDETGKLAESFNRFLSSIASLVNEINIASTSVSESSGKSSALVASINKAINSQQIALEQAATAINQMATTANDVASSCASAADSANNTKVSASEGRDLIYKTVNSVSGLGSTIEQSEQRLRQLDSESESIMSILDVIRSIAEQTNLLALNAAIEAARAGDQGRGFSVVADEVRALAQRTSESTEEIAQQLSKLRNMTQSISHEMTESLAQSEQAVDYTKEAQVSFDAITESVELISDMTTQIAAAAEEQQQVAEEINRNVVDIKTEADDISGIAADADNNSGTLAKLSTQLTAIVKKFKT